MAKYKYKISEQKRDIKKPKDLSPAYLKRIEDLYGPIDSRDFFSADMDTYFKYKDTESKEKGGGVTHEVIRLASIEESLRKLTDTYAALKDLLKADEAKNDQNIQEVARDIKQALNKYRAHLRKFYPEQYKLALARIDERINDHIDLVHVYRDGEMFGTGELVKDLGNGKVRVRFDAESEGTFLAKNVKPVKEAFDELDDGYDKKLEDIIKGGIDLHPDELKNVVYYIHNNWMAGNYGDDYAIRRISKFLRENEVEEISTSAGAGSYLTKYAFKKPKKQKELPEGTCGYDTDAKSGKKLKSPGGLEENIAATLGPGPKAGPDGVKDNYYIKKFKYKLVPKDKNGNYVQKGSGLEVKNF